MPTEQPDVFAGAGEHEGDWEHVTVRVEVDGDGLPGLHAVYYAAHTGEGDWVFPEQVPLNASGRPIVYVADKTHASYPTLGTQQRDLAPDDHTKWVPDDGNVVWEPGESRVFDARGRIVQMGERVRRPAGLAFLEYSGRWGTAEQFADSPQGPLVKSVWEANALGSDNGANHGWLFASEFRGTLAGQWGYKPWEPARDVDLATLPGVVDTTLSTCTRCAAEDVRLYLEPGDYGGCGDWSFDFTLTLEATDTPVTLCAD